jgi:tetratricopeptide (TPR) repeat protein
MSKAPTVGFEQPFGMTTFGAGPSRFTIERREGREIHREAQLEGAQVLAQVEAEVKYALGSGTRGITYLVEHDGRLFESPISWYSQKHQWDLSPGYEKGNAHFDRPIDPGCLFCHSNRVDAVALSVNRYKEPAFLGHAIGCERCHGPGELHVGDRQLVDGRDLSIVNPRHLDPILRDNVCEQCHLVGDQRVDRPGRDPFDYRPGLPLAEFFRIYGRTSNRGQRLVGQVEQMKASRCYRESQGRLGCISCHNPHEAPAPEEKIAYFRQQCLACHEEKGCKLAEPSRLALSQENNCAGCHMPTAKTVDIAHTAVTDHRIVSKPGESVIPPKARPSELPLVCLTGGAAPEELQALDRELAIAVVTEGPRLPNTLRIRNLGRRVVLALDRVLVEHPDDLVALRMKAQALALTGQRDRALPVIEAVLKAAPSYELALDDYLAYATDLGDFQAALAPAKNAVKLNPWSATYRERLAYLCLTNQDWDGALKEAREALRLDPFLRFARMFLVQCLLHGNDAEGARSEFATLTKLNPDKRESLAQWFAEERRRWKA